MSKRSKKNQIKEIAKELDAFDNMLTSLVELLEEKGILTHEEWEERIKHKIVKNVKVVNFRDIEFKKGEKDSNHK